MDNENFNVEFGEVINIGGEGGTTNFNELTNRPSYAGSTMTGSTSIPKVPTKTSELTNDGSDGDSTYVESDALARVATTGDYNDLSNKPTIPSVNNATLTIQKNSDTVGTFTANASTNKTINITVPTSAAEVSALPDSTKYGASIAVSINTSDYKVTTTLKDQDGNTLGTAQVIDLPLESVVVNGSYDSTNKKIVLTLQNGNTIDIPVGDLVAGLQSEITLSNMLDADLVDDSTSINKFVTASDKTTWSGKQNTLTAGTEIDITNDVISATNTGKAKVLTADDYNYPADNPTGVALWLLPAGIYTKTDSNVVVMASSTGTNFGLGTFILMHHSGQDQTTILAVEQNIPKEISIYYVKSSDGTNFTQGGYIVYTTDIVNTLNSSNNSKPLSAHQGRVLNEKIEGRIVTNTGAPTTSTVGTVGKILEDTTNGKLYICTDATNPYVWEEVGAGGGGGGDAVYSTKTTSDSDVGGAVYIGDKNANQEVQEDPTTTDNHYKYLWILPGYYGGTQTPNNCTINLMGIQKGSGGYGNMTMGWNASCASSCQYNTIIGYQARTESNNNNVVIGADAAATGENNTVLGQYAKNSGYTSNTVAIGKSATAAAESCVILGAQASSYSTGSVALGRGAYASRAGEVNIGADSAAYGFNSTNYRVIGGVHDGQELTDAATVAQGNTLSTTAPTTSTVGVLGQLYTDTTNMHTYQCTAISDNTYTWTQRW